MSLGRAIFARFWAATTAKVRGAEEPAARLVEAFRIFRQGTLLFGFAYASGSLFGHYVIEHGHSEGPSMFPTIPSKSPLTLTSSLHSHGKNTRVGDIINFASPIFRGEYAGKRIVGMPGDYVVHDPSQAASVGGAPVPGITDWRSREEVEAGAELKERTEPTMVEVPEGHVYVVGDNLAWSRDSRFFGPVPMALIRGKQISHTEKNVTNWTWTYGEQLRKIPKEEEEEYLRGWQQKTRAQDAAAVTDITSTSAGKVD